MKKTILITGSTDGVGRLIAKKLAREGHFLLVHGRNQKKISDTISELKRITNNENIEGFLADFSDFTAINQMADEIQKKVSNIDVLINNAGVYVSKESQNNNGFDLRFVVNYFAPYLLTKRLLPLLIRGTEPRVINLSSAAQSPVSLDILLGKRTSSQGDTYAQSKLALTMWSFYLAESIPEVHIIAVNPGSLLNTKMAREAFGNSWSSADKGANILYELTMSDKHKDISGKYFDNDRGRYGQAHPDAYDKQKIEKLIHLTDKILNLEEK